MFACGETCNRQAQRSACSSGVRVHAQRRHTPKSYVKMSYATAKRRRSCKHIPSETRAAQHSHNDSLSVPKFVMYVLRCVRIAVALHGMGRMSSGLHICHRTIFVSPEHLRDVCQRVVNRADRIKGRSKRSSWRGYNNP